MLLIKKEKKKKELGVGEKNSLTVLRLKTKHILLGISAFRHRDVQ